LQVAPVAQGRWCGGVVTVYVDDQWWACHVGCLVVLTVSNGLTVWVFMKLASCLGRVWLVPPHRWLGRQ
jgi:hypothetical protein